jgi:hypothetical protein
VDVWFERERERERERETQQMVEEVKNGGFQRSYREKTKP